MPYRTRVACSPLEDSIAGIFLLLVAEPRELDLASLFGRHETLAAVEEVQIAELLRSSYHHRRPKVLSYAESGISGLVDFAAAGLVFKIFEAAHGAEGVCLPLGLVGFQIAGLQKKMGREEKSRFGLMPVIL